MEVSAGLTRDCSWEISWEIIEITSTASTTSSTTASGSWERGWASTSASTVSSAPGRSRGRLIFWIAVRTNKIIEAIEAGQYSSTLSFLVVVSGADLANNEVLAGEVET